MNKYILGVDLILQNIMELYLSWWQFDNISARGHGLYKYSPEKKRRKWINFIIHKLVSSTLIYSRIKNCCIYILYTRVIILLIQTIIYVIRFIFKFSIVLKDFVSFLTFRIFYSILFFISIIPKLFIIYKLECFFKQLILLWWCI